MEEIVGIQVVVQGKVQGVGFRIFTENQATQLGLQGWVRNRQDGAVEVEAEGLKSTLETFLQILQTGPPLSHVTHLMVDWKESNRHTHGFIVRRDCTDGKGRS